jgi:glyoxylase-like metal-dependent hydrolase (beta-lactamase superfamily II)
VSARLHRIRLTIGLLATVITITLLAWQVVSRAQGLTPALEILQVRPNFYMIVGAGANIGAQVGPNGVLLVNAGTAEAADAVVAAIAKLTNQPVRYIIDTSADPDVVGGNGKIASAGRNIASVAGRGGNRTTIVGSDLDIARVLSHENVVTRMSAPGNPAQTVSFATAALPSESFSERRRAMYFNDEGVEILHQPAAHTDGDTIVFFRKSDVVVAGNIIDTDRFPVIDLARGGSLKGEIAALNRIIELAIPPGPFVGLPNGSTASAALQGGTDVLPGHGRIYRQIDVVNYRDMVVIVSDIIQDLIDKKMTLDQIKNADPAKPYKARYGATSGSWTTNDFVEAVYRSLTQ